MRRISLAVAAALAAAGCSPDIEKSPPPPTVEARFDPAAVPPVVPSPNSLALDPTGTHLDVAKLLPPDASAAERERAAFLDTLNGFPSDTPGLETFTGSLNASTVSKSTVVVWDVTAREQPVPGAGPGTPTYVEPPAPAAPEIVIAPPATGWTAGHTYAVALIGGTPSDSLAVLKGKNQETVVGSPTWFLIRSEESLVTCEDLTSELHPNDGHHPVGHPGARGSARGPDGQGDPAREAAPAARAAARPARGGRRAALQRGDALDLPGQHAPGVRLPARVAP
jgi:hypothetical protein